ncbi:hypothetical protein Efla_001014 [Eimeria flavescens]
MIGEKPLRASDLHVVDAYEPTLTPPMTKLFPRLVDRPAANTIHTQTQQQFYAKQHRQPAEFEGLTLRCPPGIEPCTLSASHLSALSERPSRLALRARRASGVARFGLAHSPCFSPSHMSLAETVPSIQGTENLTSFPLTGHATFSYNTGALTPCPHFIPELFPAQPSGPQTGPAAHSSLPSGHHSSSSHPSFGSHKVVEALAAAIHRLKLSSQVSQAPPMSPFSFKIEHMSGTDNVVADLLSRLPEKAETSVTIASARSHEDPAETHSLAAYALALTAPETHARDALMSDIRRYRAGAHSTGITCSFISSASTGQIFVRDDNVYFCTTRLYIPKHPVLRTRLIAEHCDSSCAGHPGRNRATEFLSCGFCWPSLSQDVKAYVKSCDVCMRNRVTRHSVAPPSSPITAPSRWHTVSLAVLGPFNTNSPATPGGNTCTLVFMDKLTKMLRLASCP